jgi:uncharacterized protein YhbP (UPF0306 family)
MNVEATIREYLPQVIHMSLATCSGDKPWVCEVHFVYDDDLNLYFRSTPARRHSQEIAANPNIAGNIVTQHHLGQPVRGVYFEGTANKLTNVDEEHIAYKLVAKRFGLGPEILEDAGTDTGHGFYQITVSDYYLFDGYKAKPATKHHLPWKREGNS